MCFLVNIDGMQPSAAAECDSERLKTGKDKAKHEWNLLPLSLCVKNVITEIIVIILECPGFLLMYEHLKCNVPHKSRLVSVSG